MEDAGRVKLPAGGKRPLLVVVAATMLIIAGISIGMLFWSWPTLEGDAVGHRLEVTKAALQVLGVAILGGLAALSFAGIRQRWADDRQERIERAERWQREGQALQVLAEDTIRAYNNLKRIRRVLRNDIHSRKTNREDEFQKHLAELNDIQLEFERLKRVVPFSVLNHRLMEVTIKAANDVTGGEVTQSVAGLGNQYGKVDRFLGKVLGLWESGQPLPDRVPPASASGDGSGRLGDLLRTDPFREHVTNNINVALAVLLQTRLMPPGETALSSDIPGAADNRPARSPAEAAAAR